jgi:REP element-mobilizing transposase RayT
MVKSREPQRKPVRLKGYDYSQPGGYFVTICTQDRILLFEDDNVRKIAEGCWRNIPEHFPFVELDQWVIMPNHLHGIILIHDQCRGEAFSGRSSNKNVDTENASPLRYPNGTAPRSLGAIIQNFKSISTRKVNQHRRTPGQTFWQRGYYDRIIRNEKELNRIQKYIAENPLKWKLDPYYV